MLRTITLSLVASAALVALPSAASGAIEPGTHQILNRQDPKCLDVTYAQSFNGAPVGVWQCVNAANQRWTLDRTSTGTFKLRVAHTGKCLSVQWRGDGYGSEVVQDDCAVAESWDITTPPDGWSFIHTRRPPTIGPGKFMCLDKYNGWDVTVWECNGARWQQWSSLG